MFGLVWEYWIKLPLKIENTELKWLPLIHKQQLLFSSDQIVTASYMQP